MSYDFDGARQELVSKKDFEYFSFEEGENTIRVLALASKEHALHYHYLGGKFVLCIGQEEGCQYHTEDSPMSHKYVAYVWDGKKIMSTKLPHSVFKKIIELSGDSEWGFTDFPMPYSVGVTYNKNKPPAEQYSVVPKMPKDLPSEVLAELNELEAIDSVAEKIKESLRKKALENSIV